MALLNVMGDKDLVGFGILLGEMFLFHFCSFLFF